MEFKNAVLDLQDFDVSSHDGVLKLWFGIILEVRLGLWPWSESHTKNLHPEGLEVDPKLLRLQVKNDLPWFGPGFETKRRFDLRPQGHKGGVERHLKFQK